MLGDGSDDFDDFADFCAGFSELANGSVGGLRGLYGVRRDGGGLVSVGGDRLDGCGHLFGAGRDALQILADLLGSLRDGAGLGRSLFRVGGDLLAGRGKLLAGAGHVLDVLPDLGHNFSHFAHEQI